MTNLATVKETERSNKTVAILLCTYNGVEFLEQQLRSIQNQSYTDWRLWVSDDGSSDSTREIIGRFQAKWPLNAITITEGPRQGSTKNFLTLACNPKIQAAWYAFCDQDDIWDADKLSRALAWLESKPKTTPALYCTRTRLVDRDNREIGFSPFFHRAPSFRNALVQNIANGNTMVFNHAAMNLVREAGAQLDVVIHDWWLYLLVTSCGGTVFYDPHPSIRYRQHGTNLIGANDGPWQRLKRLKPLLEGRYKAWGETNEKALNKISNKINQENIRILHQSSSLRRDTSIFSRLFLLKKMGIYRQTFAGNLSLTLAVILGKF